MKTALIFLHGDLTCISHIPAHAKATELIIAADGGAEYAIACGLSPHVLIGDMDSISPSTMEQLNNKTIVKVYPREKDYTDAELAIQYAVKEKATSIYIAGFLGRRIDHMMATLFYLSTLPAKFTLLEGAQRATLIKEKTIITGKKDDEISLIPLQGDCIGITTEGLVYPLHNETLPYGATRGVSNIMNGEKATIEIHSGTLLCIQTSDPSSAFRIP